MQASLLTIPLISLTLLTGCATGHTKESTGQYIDGSIITAKVKANLLADKQVRGLPITVRTYKNTVQLSGFVDNRAQENRAIEIARNVEGVGDVKDSLVIKSH